MNHATARGIIHHASPPWTTAPMWQIVQGISWIETEYGRGWKGAGVGSHNWGAMQGSFRGQSFSYNDTHPAADGSSKTYSAHFRKYPDDAAGAEDLAEWLFGHRHVAYAIASVVTGGPLRAVDAAMHGAGYYEGFGPTPEERIDHHWKALSHAIWTQVQAGLDATVPHGICPRTLHRGTTGPDVMVARAFLGMPGDTWDKQTLDKTRAWQAAHELVADGIWGPRTEAAARKEQDSWKT